MTFVSCSFPEREYRCLGQWTEDGLIYTYTERRDMIGYECFVGLLTAKGDIHLREAGNNCERGHEPLNLGMKLTQVSKCLREPRIRWRSETTKKPRRKITALPSWKERELNSNMIGYGVAPARIGGGAYITVLLSICLSWLLA